MSKLRQELIEAGLWNADDSRDPAMDWQTFDTMMERIEQHLAPEVDICSHPVEGKSLNRAIFLTRGDEERYLANGEPLTLAICRAALALPDFLEQHPEWSARAKVGKMCLMIGFGFQFVCDQVRAIEALSLDYLWI